MFILNIVIVLGCWEQTLAPSRRNLGQTAKKRSTDAGAPPIPALKYQFMFDNTGIGYSARQFVLDSVLLLNADTREQINNAPKLFHRQEGIQFDCRFD